MVRVYNLFIVALALSTPSLAAAQTMSFGESAGLIASSCGADITANCRGVNLDSNRLKECLSRNQDVVSAQCKATYFKAFEAIQKRISARVTVANACQREIVKLCGGSTKETSKSIPCLLTTSGVSARCQQAISEAGYR
ncbi:hypothetical protein [Bradyrhizobium sp. STM 3809]|uniref:hypothetical protein n=1 Tax=Bradyrhizobium sp. STM 3809 TaxID=551936 RepID=UPI000240A279|nr:hypothetical protein [Bradyrhizobium sp. STM 3809]CCE02107.1 conserved exported hypothetical protein [Bradyrhizobium sp. STM 3809]